MNFSLERFLDAQRHSYDQALSEIQKGRKQGHWMWFIFPQMKGLGKSHNADFYGINNLEEAKAYLEHPILGFRLREITSALLELEEMDAETVFGPIDAIKLRSSLSLFNSANCTSNNIFKTALNKFFNGEKDQKTLGILNLEV